MRILLSPSTKKELLVILKNKHKCKSLKELSSTMNISFKTLQGWFYLSERLIPSEIISNELNSLEISDKRENNWGQIKGGKIVYERTINKYGSNELKRRQSLGGTRGAKTKELISLSNFKIDIADPNFLEFYGNLLGDGWLSNYKSQGKFVWLIGMCCNLKNEKDLLERYKQRIKILFNRDRKIIEIPKGNVANLVFGHKLLLEYLNKTLKFPIGVKENLYIHNSITSLGFDKVKYVLKGLFDTDGTFFLQKNRKKIPTFPVIAFHMNELKLLKQVGDILTNEGFRVNYSDGGKMIRIQGIKQTIKWLNKIGSSNIYKLNKMQQSVTSYKTKTLSL